MPARSVGARCDGRLKLEGARPRSTPAHVTGEPANQSTTYHDIASSAVVHRQAQASFCQVLRRFITSTPSLVFCPLCLSIQRASTGDYLAVHQPLLPCPALPTLRVQPLARVVRVAALALSYCLKLAQHHSRLTLLLSTTQTLDMPFFNRNRPSVSDDNATTSTAPVTHNGHTDHSTRKHAWPTDGSLNKRPRFGQWLKGTW